MLHHLPPPTEKKARTVAIWLNVIMISFSHRLLARVRADTHGHCSVKCPSLDLSAEISLLPKLEHP